MAKKGTSETVFIRHVTARTVTERRLFTKCAVAKGILVENTVVEGDDDCLYARLNLSHTSEEVLQEVVDAVKRYRSESTVRKAA